MIPNLNKVILIVFDFDGVFTDNKVYVNENGIESVRCDRADGLGIDLLKQFIKKKSLELDMFILSKEKNKIVKTRGKKLNIKVYNNQDCKLAFLKNYFKKKEIDFKSGLKKTIYLGNDINDLEVMMNVNYSVAPSDAHDLIKRNADLVLKEKGGDGFVRKFIELLIGLNKLQEKEIIKL